MALRHVHTDPNTKMQYKFLGNTGLRVSVISFGAWLTWGSTVDDDMAFQCMKTAFDAGINFFDNAEAYAQGKAEETMGRCIKRLNVARSELVISTKIYWGGKGVNQHGLSRKHIVEGLNACLSRLQLDYVDLLFCHRPDLNTPIEETVRAMNYVINQGKAFYWGTSEWSASQIMQAHNIAERLGLMGPVMEQPQYNILHRTRFELEYAPLYREINLGTTIWSPLASGLLSGKYSAKEFEAKNFAEENRLGKSNAKGFANDFLEGKGLNGTEESKDIPAMLEKIEQLKQLAATIGCTLAQLAIAWCVANPNVTTVITGASKTSQITENVKALEFVPKLTTEVMAQIDKIVQNKPANERNWRPN